MKRSFVFLFLFVMVVSASAQEQTGGELTLNEAIGLALKNNLSIEIQKYNPELRDTDIREAQARFEPLLSGELFTRDQQTPSGSSLVGAGAVKQTDQVWNFTLEQLLKTSTSYRVQFNNGRQTTDQLFVTVDPRFDSSVFAAVTQPLMRDFGSDIAQTPIFIAQKNRLAADFRLQQQVADIALQVEQAYWDLVFARGELSVVKQALSTAQNLYENNKKQVEVGTMAPLEIVVAEAEVAQREQQIIRVQTTIGNVSDLLRFLIYGKDATNQPITPADQPVIQPIIITEEEAIQRALAGNPDLKAVEADLESRKLNVRLARNELKPRLDLQASYGGTGLGGDTKIFGGDDPFNPILIDVLPGSYADSLSTLFDNSTWQVGFIVGIPIGNGFAKANYARADLEQKQVSTTVAQTRQFLIQNVRSLVRNLEDNLKTLEAARASRVLQEKKLDAERKKLEVGLSTNYVVLEFTSDLALAQSTELQAIVEYNKNHAQLQRFFGTTVK